LKDVETDASTKTTAVGLLRKIMLQGDSSDKNLLSEIVMILLDQLVNNDSDAKSVILKVECLHTLSQIIEKVPPTQL